MAQAHEHDDPRHQAPRVLIFFDYACPFCYVDQHRLDRLRDEYPGVQWFLVPFELRPDMPEEGYQVSELEASGFGDRVEEHLQRIARTDGFPMLDPPFLPKTHKALVLGEMARDLGEDGHRRTHAAIFAAYFAEGRDIGDPEVLHEIAGGFGFLLADVDTAWDTGAYDERLHQYRHVAMNLGLDSTPAALICNELLVGSRPYRVLADALERCMVTPDNVEQQAEDSAPA
ncbi:MAG: DsbA family protein [Actinomycetota bacterium]|nr:DsbA family protein [Actinomycetota bacterium]